MKKWTEGQVVNISEHFNDLSIEIVAMVMLGNKFFEEWGKWEYIQKNGECKKMVLTEAMQYTSDDWDESYENPVSHHWSYLNENSIGQPYARDAENIREIHQTLNEYLHK